MITPDELEGLQPDDLVETYPLFRNMAPDALVELKVIEKPSPTKAVFIALWHGITLGRWTAALVDNAVKWEFQ